MAECSLGLENVAFMAKKRKLEAFGLFSGGFKGKI